jgi:CRP/FNR family transcriptional regulator, cyclic AMP receptor protein
VETSGIGFIEDLGRLALFVDLPREELEQIAASTEEVSFGEGEWIIRQGDPQSSVYVIVEGEVQVMIHDESRRVLPIGSFFGEVAVLLDEPATASVITRSPVTCLVIPGADLKAFLVAHPLVTYRFLKAEARRLKTASEWRT